MAVPTVVHVGVGANLGDAAATVRTALEELARLPGSELTGRSSLYRSAPVDAAGPPFVNAVARLATVLDAQALLDELQRIERRHGRERPYRNAPRTLDLDLLLYGTARIDGTRLVVPHPRMHRRAFVLLPLLELSPDAEIPGLGRAAHWLAGVAGQEIERLAP